MNSFWAEAQNILLAIGRDHSYRLKSGELDALRQSPEAIMFTETERSVSVRIHDQQLTLTLRYLCKFHKRSASEQAIWAQILQKFQATDSIHLLAKEEG